MSHDFTIIAITPPFFFEGEAGRINRILSDNEARFIHIRKPSATAGEIERLISDIDTLLHPRLKLHDHFEIMEKFNIGGLHLNSRNPSLPPVFWETWKSNPSSKCNPESAARKTLSVSKSIHSLDEIEDTGNLDYFFISPVFDSISKQGYKTGFNFESLSAKIKGRNAIALGGVTPDKFPFLKKIGFSGAAMLGHFFPSINR